jgi:hypothetical protein
VGASKLSSQNSLYHSGTLLLHPPNMSNRDWNNTTEWPDVGFS